MKSSRAWAACCQAVVFACSWAQAGKPTPMYYKAEPLIKALAAADQAHDDSRAEEIAREILKLQMDPAEHEYLTGCLFRPLQWLRDHGRLEAWLADADKELEATPDAKHLLWFIGLGWEYQSYFNFEVVTTELGKAKPPVSLRIKREGAKRTAGMSQDGKQWTEREIAGWKSDKPCLWGFASATVPLSEAVVPASFQPYTLDSSAPDETPWVFEKPLSAGIQVSPRANGSPCLELHPVTSRVDALMDTGWLLHRAIEGDATLSARVDSKPPWHESGLRVTLWSGHYSPRIYLRLDDDGVVRCTVRRYDARGALAYLRLAQACPDVLWVQSKAAERLAMLGLDAEAFPVFERMMDRNFVGTVSSYPAWPLTQAYFHAGREEELARRLLAWHPPPGSVKNEEIPVGSYTSVAAHLAEKKKWELALQVSYRAMELSPDKDFAFRATVLQVVDCLEALKQKDALSGAILDGLFGRAVDESRGKAGTTPPHWTESGGSGGDDGPWCPSLALLAAAQRNQCGTVVWQTIRKIIPADTTDELGRMDRVLAGIAAQDPAVLDEWRRLMRQYQAGELSQEFFLGGEYFFVGAATMLERWTGHDREAMETWLAAAYIDLKNIEAKRRVTSSHCAGYEDDLFMGDGAIRCALKLKDVETARKVITVLNNRFQNDRKVIIKDITFVASGVRILRNAIDQKHPELARLFLDTVDALTNAYNISDPQSRREASNPPL